MSYCILGRGKEKRSKSLLWVGFLLWLPFDVLDSYTTKLHRMACWRRCFLFLFYWSIIALQCCICLCCTAKGISYVYAYGVSLLGLHPPRSSQSTELSAPCYTAASHWYLFCTWYCIYLSATLPIRPSHSFHAVSTFCLMLITFSLYELWFYVNYLSDTRIRKNTPTVISSLLIAVLSFNKLLWPSF